MFIFPIKKIGKQGTWVSAFSLFLTPLLAVFLIRWLFIEPFVIPSESMMPNLMIHDHVLVSKFGYGIKMPFGDGWLVKYKQPKRGDIIVFRYPENREVFFIKRLIGLPGDKISVQNGQISINDKPWTIGPIGQNSFSDETDFSYFIETIPGKNSEAADEHLIRLFANRSHVDPIEKIFEVPGDSYFVMGDNRDQSHDSRFWGFVPEKYLVGRALSIWLSCEETIPTAPMICDPLKLRTERIFKKVGGI